MKERHISVTTTFVLCYFNAVLLRSIFRTCLFDIHVFYIILYGEKGLGRFVLAIFFALNRSKYTKSSIRVVYWRYRIHLHDCMRVCSFRSIYRFENKVFTIDLSTFSAFSKSRFTGTLQAKKSLNIWLLVCSIIRL